jgi:hypothetical protein
MSRLHSSELRSRAMCDPYIRLAAPNGLGRVRHRPMRSCNGEKASRRNTTTAHPSRGGAAKPGVSMRWPGSRKSPNARHPDIRPPSGSGNRNIERRCLLRWNSSRKPGATRPRNSHGHDAGTSTVSRGPKSQPTRRGQSPVPRPRPQAAALPPCAPTLDTYRSARRASTHLEREYSQ